MIEYLLNNHKTIFPYLKYQMFITMPNSIPLERTIMALSSVYWYSSIFSILLDSSLARAIFRKFFSVDPFLSTKAYAGEQ